MSKAELEKTLDIRLNESFTLISFHPVTLESDTTSEAYEFYAALRTIGGQQIFCFPNCDAGSRKLIRLTEAYCASNSDAHIFENLDHWTYWSVLHCATVMLGNSSSALMEAPSIPLPAVNIGRRQEGRLMAASVIDCEAKRDTIVSAYQKAIDFEFTNSIKHLKNPYGDGTAAEQMCEFLLQHCDRDKLLNKQAGVVTTQGQQCSFKHLE